MVSHVQGLERSWVEVLPLLVQRSRTPKVGPTEFSGVLDLVPDPIPGLDPPKYLRKWDMMTRPHKKARTRTEEDGEWMSLIHTTD